ncbi:CvpA family protein [Phenylobacterium sp.]|jgi:membrane protein required for colicin V production|uniref:CvpA family protein n=1 Tax=Phenylobacterium sp. TaxID=1871053 RepID=UPI002E31C0F5|nr:CvpA family protein [Phenylobacterium sp.]HEX4709193.1 CvpA family protein [Phenylobacterium sp.]
MTQFDVIVLILLGISAIVGFARGAVSEIVSLVALVVAAGLAIFGLPISAPAARKLIHPDWLATAAALLVVFVVSYLVLRMLGAAIAGRIQQTRFVGALDRSVGLAIGLARGLIVLGALDLMFNAATPKDLQPRWIVGSTTWPLAQNMGRLLTAMAPKGLDIAGRLKPAFDRALHTAGRDALDDRLKSEGYDARQRREIEDLVEKSR